MSNSARILIALVIGAGVGWFVRSPARAQQITVAATRQKLTSDDHLVVVGAAVGGNPEDLSEDPIQVSKKLNHRIRWVAPTDVYAMDILFYATDFPPTAKKEPPFDRGTGLPGIDQKVSCLAGTVCTAPVINTKLPPLAPHSKYYFKYWQIFYDSPGHESGRADGLIIIEP